MDAFDRMGNVGHPEEDILERYVMKICSEPEVDAIEDHLLVCEHCRNRLYCAEEWVALMKSAVPLGPSRPKAPQWHLPFGPLAVAIPAIPRPALLAAFGALAALLIAGPILVEDRLATDQVVALSASRGGAPGQTSAMASSWNRLVLEPDTTGLAGPLEIRVVDGTGAVLFSHPLSPAGEQVRLNRKLKPGRYWVDINSAGADHANLREFELRIQ